MKASGKHTTNVLLNTKAVTRPLLSLLRERSQKLRIPIGGQYIYLAACCSMRAQWTMRRNVFFKRYSLDLRLWKLTTILRCHTCWELGTQRQHLEFYGKRLFSTRRSCRC